MHPNLYLKLYLRYMRYIVFVPHFEVHIFYTCIDFSCCTLVCTTICTTFCTTFVVHVVHSFICTTFCGTYCLCWCNPLHFPVIQVDVELYNIWNTTRFPKGHTPQVRPDFVSTVNLGFSNLFQNLQLYICICDIHKIIISYVINLPSVFG